MGIGCAGTPAVEVSTTDVVQFNVRHTNPEKRINIEGQVLRCNLNILRRGEYCKHVAVCCFEYG